MTIAKTLAIRGVTLVGVLFAVLVMVVVTLGATGFSDRMLTAIVNEEVRGLRQGLAQTIRDADELGGRPSRPPAGAGSVIRTGPGLVPAPSPDDRTCDTA